MSESLIPSFLVSDVSESLRSLNKKWAIRSHCSEEMSNCERIAKDAHQKWANEWISRFFERIAHSLIFGQKQVIRSENQWANSQPWVKHTIQSLYFSVQKIHNKNHSNNNWVITIFKRVITIFKRVITIFKRVINIFKSVIQINKSSIQIYKISIETLETKELFWYTVQENHTKIINWK